MNAPSHAQHHTALATAIEAIEAKVGVDSSAVATSLDYRVRALEAAVSPSITTKTSDFTADASNALYLCNATGGAFTCTLPPVADSANVEIVVKKTDDSDNFVTVRGNSTEPIDGSNQRILPVQYNSVRLRCDGTAWYVI
jgi:hypothetical protein